MNPTVLFRRLIFLIGSLFLVSCASSIAPAINTETPSQQQRLRIINQSNVSLINLVVIFPNERIEFGDVPAGSETEYLPFPEGVYRYAAYEVTIDGVKYEQPVVDWVGESPIHGKDITYTLDVDISQWTTHGQVILLVNINEDR
ncbi:MAG: hypothetical protein GYA20_00640 [Chloroflexi bacterium]|nr:hypothetical protein [Chloroflexota bacterium]